ncbi:protein GLUTAMINE DUMPER 2-like [Prosopis cineraria]|uniref:protein GLUTAMINE DUMPER 2-like n=1 Tax=Prosopis cineraria TaxID=364024 RepID=UPI00240FF1F5|nr:protein GLUTAMINE DUMPER 2-like [Prosopis cineraria]
MRPINSGSSGLARLWKSPIPYLFGGLAIMMALISVALVVLICSYSKRAYSQSHSPSSAGEDTVTKQAMPKNPETESEPRVLVIMAGDRNPTYLAKPTSGSTFCSCEAGSIQ